MDFYTGATGEAEINVCGLTHHTVLPTAGGLALTLVLSLSRTGVHTCVFMDTEMHLHPSCTAVCTKPARSDMTDCCHVNSYGREQLLPRLVRP